MLTILRLLLAATTTAVATATTYMATAKRNIIITNEEAAILWKIHKQASRCKSHKMQTLTCGHGDITGFQCQCEYGYTQEKPLLSHRLQHNFAGKPRVDCLQLDAPLSSACASSNSALK